MRIWKKRRTWTRVDATITSVKEKKDPSDPAIAYYTIKYRFVDATGQRRTGRETHQWRKRRRGSPISVMYDPDDPDRNETSSVAWLYFTLPVTAVMFAFGAWLLADGFAELTGWPPRLEYD